MFVTATRSITAVGFDSESTAIAVEGGIAALAESDEYTDANGEPIQIAEIPIVADITDHEDRDVRLRIAACHGLIQLRNDLLERTDSLPDCVYILLGVAAQERPGLRIEGDDNELLQDLMRLFDRESIPSRGEMLPSGNASAAEAVSIAKGILEREPNSIVVIGAVDTLLDEATLDWLEDEERLKSASYGRNQGTIPGEGIGFFALESRQRAEGNLIAPSLSLLGVGVAREPAPISTKSPSSASGLTRACQQAIAMSGIPAKDIAVVLSDLNGEFHRSKEWAITEIRCVPASERQRTLYHPAEYYGDVGAASGALLINLSANLSSLGYLDDPCLCVSSDDYGLCGAIVAARPRLGE